MPRLPAHPIGSAVRLPNLPRPLPDELLYSLVARSAVHVGFWEAKPLLRALYRGITKPACPDLPGSLSRLARASGGAWGMTARELALRHTLIRYYTQFLPTAERKLAVKRMLEVSGHLHLRLGISASGVRPVSFYRLCPACTRDDLKCYGETYWRRSHHLPGVYVCHEHGERLMETEVPFRPVRRYDHVYAHPDLLKRSKRLVPHLGVGETLMAIARRSAYWLEEEGGSDVPDYREALRSRGFNGCHGGPLRFREAVARLFPKSLLAELFTEFDNDGFPHWLDAARRKPRTAMHPLKHLIVQMVLERVPHQDPAARKRPDLRGKSLEPELREIAQRLAQAGLTTRRIALHLGCAWKTAARLLEPVRIRSLPLSIPPRSADRDAWLSLREDDPNASRTVLRRKAPALYMRLYRGDRAWLVAQACAPAVRESKLRLDWEERDADLTRQVAAEADRLVAQVPFVRITRTKILSTLRAESLFYQNKLKLPGTVSTLAERTETIEAFQLRRLVALLEMERGRGIQDWVLLRRARINTQRLRGNGASLIASARRIAQCS